MSIAYQKLRIYTLQRLGYDIIHIIAKLDNNVWKEKMYLRVLLHESERKRFWAAAGEQKRSTPESDNCRVFIEIGELLSGLQ